MRMFCLAAILAGFVLGSFPASAQTNINDPYPKIVSPYMTQYGGQIFGYQICPIVDYNTSDPSAVLANREQFGFMKRMILCVKGLVIPATYKIMYKNSLDYFYAPIAAACTLAVVIWGFLMVVGKRGAQMRDAFVVALKIGAVSLFTFVLGKSGLWPQGLFPIIIEITDEFARIVTSYIGYSTTMKCAATLNAADMWGRVDCAMNTLLGSIFNPTLLLAGLLGFFVCAFISGTFGLFIAFAGFAIIFILVTAILRATYITITAYVALALSAIISPIFITAILFNVTRAYFEKWLKLTMGFILQPMFLFAYLAMMLAAFDTVVYDGRYSIYRAIASPAAIGVYPAPLKPYPPQNPTTNPYGDFQIGNWLYDLGVYHETEVTSFGVGTNPRADTSLEDTDTGMGGSTGSRPVPSNDFGEKDAAGIPINALNQLMPLGLFKVDFPIHRISWLELSLLHLCTTQGCTAQSKNQQIKIDICGGLVCNQDDQKTYDARIYNIMIEYLVNLILALLIAFLTLYIFYLMLDKMPFIGAGMGGGPKGMPNLGNMQSKANKLFDKMKAGAAKMMGGAG